MSLSLSPVATTGVLFPLYIYPSGGAAAWEPLYTTINDNPAVDFYVILNIDSGPGADATPNSDYTPAIVQLKQFSNVTPLGYVHTTWGAQTIEAVEANITKWGNFDNNGGYASVNGIFFDEAPNDSEHVSYMSELSSFAKTTFPDPRGFVVFNPGATVDPGYFNAADAIVIFENTGSEYKESVFANQQGAMVSQQKSAIIYDFTGTAAEQTTIVNGMVDQGAGLVFITDQNSYTAFSGLLSKFVAAITAAIS